MTLIYEEPTERRKAAAERQRKHRAKVKEVAMKRLAEEDKRKETEFDERRVRLNLVMPGEISPFVDANNISDALAVARQFLVALAQPDIQPGECLLDVERRVMSAWHADGRLLCRTTIRLDGEKASAVNHDLDFDNKWIPLPGSDEPIDIGTLPVIEVPAVVEVPTVELVEDAAAKELAIKVAAICRAQQDAVDAEARRISAKNLQRQLEK